MLVLWANLVTILGVAWLTYYVRSKAENLAKKQDLEALSEITERIRIQFENVHVVHRVQFEAEFRHYGEVWLAAHKAHKQFVCLHPRGGLALLPELLQQEQEQFEKELFVFTDALNTSKPFIPQAVAQVFEEFENVMVYEKANNAFFKKPITDLQEYRAKAQAALDRCEEAIRQRLSALLIL